MTNRLQIRRDTAAAWTSANPVLAAGEPALETDTGKRKLGDGVTAWVSLAYDVRAADVSAGVATAAADATSKANAAQAAAISAAATDATSKVDGLGASLPATYVTLTAAAKSPDLLIVGSVTRNANDVITAAAVVWPDGSPGTFTTVTIDASNAINGYTITYGSPVTRTFTQPTITRNANGAATTVPAIAVS